MHGLEDFFFDAAKTELKKLEFTLSNLGANVNFRDNTNMTPLHYAVEDCNEDFTEYLITQNADINAMDNCGKTILYYAVEKRCVDMVRLILQHQPNLYNKGNQRAAALAVKIGFYRVIRNFLESGFTPLPEDPSNEMYKAVCSGDVVRLHRLLETFSINRTFRNSLCGESLLAMYLQAGLYYSLKFNQAEVAELLINYGADVNGKDCWGHTLIYAAVVFQNYDFISLFVQSSQEEIDREAMFTAVKLNLPLALEILLEYGGDPNARRKNGNTLLHYAARNGSVCMAKALIERGAMVNKQNKKKETPLHIAVSRKKINTTRLLLKSGAKVNVRDAKWFTPLHVACNFEDDRFVRLLISFGADIELEKFYGNGDETPLHIACRNGREKVIRFLVYHGANINFLQDDYSTPIQSAFVKGVWRYTGRCYPESAIEFLLHHMAKLHIAGFPLCKENVEALDDGLTNVSEDIRPECQVEIYEMKQDKVLNHLSYFDILKCGDKKFVQLFRNDVLKDVLQSGIYKEKYPLYADMILSKIKIAERKLLLHAVCQEFFNFVCPELPSVCLEHIYDYLTDRELMLLVCVVRPSNVRRLIC